ncbi:MAG: hypothetical protein ACRENB_12150 [Gemmatimonadales bacterium]
MRAAVLSLAALVTLAAAAGAQTKTDFSGTWKRNAEKSDPIGGPGGGGGGGGGGMGTSTSVVTQAADKIVIATTFGENTRTLTYTLDGKESVNPGMRGGETRSTARWDGAALVIESTSTRSTPSGDVTITSKEVRTISEDGKTMTVVTTSTSPMGEQTRKTVYDKQ